MGGSPVTRTSIPDARTNAILIMLQSAKILAHFILDDPKLRSYSDIGRKAFGARSSPLISALFCLELFTVR